MQFENEENSLSEESETENRVRIREELSKMSFEELQKLKNKIGSKKYKEITTEENTKQTKIKIDNNLLKRENKNRPREMSSKIRTNFKITNPQKKTTTINKSRDPRFDPLCGNYEEKYFKENYKFVNEIRKNERKQLERDLENCNDDKEKKKIKFLIQRMDNQLREEDKRQKENEKKREEMKEIKDKLKRGEKPVFKKKSEKKIESLVSQYEDLKKRNKLQKHIEKRTKKLDRKNKMPQEFC